MKDLHDKYRPKTFDEILGQETAVNSLKNFFNEKKVPHAFIFTGTSGVGKTTIARVLASELKCEEVIEIDGASHTGVDDMKNVAENLKYSSMFGNGIKFLILDEAHMLSKNAWNSWLKIIEEPPSHLYFSFCTTEYGKIPETIKKRCHVYKLRPLGLTDLVKIIDRITEAEGIELPQYGKELIVKASEGSARQAIVYLSQARYCKTLNEISDIIDSAIDNDHVLELCRLIINHGGADNAMEIMAKIRKDGINPYSVKMQVIEYLTTCVLKNRMKGDFINSLSAIIGCQDTFAGLLVTIYNLLK